MRNIILFFSILFFTSTLQATIIAVPSEIDSIQGGINLATNGDTVLVQPGTYIENINFKGKNIVVGSLTLTTGDTSYISRTVIDGNSSGSVATFENGEDSTAVLLGFTIFNGSGYTNFWGVSFGGGIYISDASPKVMNLKITGNICNEGAGVACINSNSKIMHNSINNNTANLYWGGGIMCESFGGVISDNYITNNQGGSGGGLELTMQSSPLITNNVISNNKAKGATSGMGGGIILYTRCNPTLKNNLISNNEASWGGGIFLHMDSNPILYNNTISNNIANSTGGGIYSRYHSNQKIINSIFWNNSPQEIYCNDNNGLNTIAVAYSDIYGGSSSIVNGQLYWLRGNINADPLFIDITNGNFGLQAGSPCIDAGIQDTTIMYNNEQDTLIVPTIDYIGSTPDIGAYEYGPPSTEESDFIESMPLEFKLKQNYPNPFNLSTTIEYQIPEASKVNLYIYNILGQNMSSIVMEKQQAGKYKVKWDASRFTTGIYFYCLKIDNSYTLTRKLILLK